MISNKTISIISRVFLHTLFWALSVFSFAIIFRLSSSVNKLDYIYSLLFHISIITSVYLNFWSISTLFKRRRYVLYTTLSIIIIAFTVFLNQLTFSKIIDLVLTDYYFVSQFNSYEIAILVVLYLAITSAIKLSKSWFELQNMKSRITEAEKEKSTIELQTLKAQINPHFLFNSLNVIYSLTLNNDKKTPDVILKLSDILRYLIYDSTKGQTTLKSEIEILEKYIEIQKYRTEESTPVSFNYKVKYDIEIEPLLFLPLVENSFKHGVKGDTENVFVNINLYADNKKVCFEIENNKKEHNVPSKPSGIGMQNIRKRLLLLYPNKHSFIVNEEEGTFKVYLEIRNES